MARTVFDGGMQMYRQMNAEEARREVDRLQAENERLREALQWYADRSNFVSGDYTLNHHARVHLDQGSRARAALGSASVE